MSEREKEYRRYLAYCVANGETAVDFFQFNFLEWMHSKQRADYLRKFPPDGGPMTATEVVRRQHEAGTLLLNAVADACGSRASLRPYTSEERKAMPIYSGVLKYFPDALAAVSRVSKAGNDKHNPGEPLHWARGKSTDQMDAAIRHTLTPGVLDEDSGEVELAHAVWRVLAELQLAEEKRLVTAGIRPLSGVVE